MEADGDLLVLAQYLFATSGHSPTQWELKGVAVAAYSIVALRKALTSIGGIF